MLRTKIIVCVVLFAVLCAAGWVAEKHVQNSRPVKLQRLVEGAPDLLRSLDYPYSPVFLPREYVKVMRLRERLTEQQ